MDGFIQNKEQFMKRYRNAVAILLILIGAASLCNIGSDWLYQLLGTDDYYYILDFARQIPAIILAVFLIVFGVHLIRGKYEELENEEAAHTTATPHGHKEFVASTENTPKAEDVPIKQIDAPQKEDNSNENA